MTNPHSADEQSLSDVDLWNRADTSKYLHGSWTSKPLHEGHTAPSFPPTVMSKSFPCSFLLLAHNTPEMYLQEQNNMYPEAQRCLNVCVMAHHSVSLRDKQCLSESFLSSPNSLRNHFLQSLRKFHPMFYSFTYALLKAAKLHLYSLGFIPPILWTQAICDSTPLGMQGSKNKNIR